MQLTTPEFKDFDPSLPGENFFFYWKTSASLWEQKLNQARATGPIIIPINWALHNEYPDQFDFGDRRPESDILRLLNILNEQSISYILTIFLGPSPLLPNGGIPSFLVKNMSLNKDLLAKCYLDLDDRLNKMYSFFDPIVFQGFRKFAFQLNKLLTSNNIKTSVFGISSFTIEDGEFHNSIEDYSIAFEHGFHRYLQQQNSEASVDNYLKNPKLEQQQKSEYFYLIKDLYEQSSSEIFGNYWKKVLKINFLDSGPRNLLKRAFQSGSSGGEKFYQLLNSIIYGYIPSSLLIPHSQKGKLLEKAISHTVDSAFVSKTLSDDLYGEDDLTFELINQFTLYSKMLSSKQHKKKMDNTGLLNFLSSEFSWMYRFSSFSDFQVIDEEFEAKVYFFFGESITSSEFRYILKLFFQGGDIFIDVAGISSDVKNQLESFLLENSIDSEKVNYVTYLERVSLGDGSLYLYDGDKLSGASLPKQLSFWKSLFDFLNIRTPAVEIPDGIISVWKSRGSNTYELDFEEIRRLHLYNPTSYKKKVHINASKHFAYIKSIDPVLASIDSTPLGINVEIKPGGNVMLDFGYYE